MEHGKKKLTAEEKKALKKKVRKMMGIKSAAMGMKVPEFAMGGKMNDEIKIAKYKIGGKMYNEGGRALFEALKKKFGES